MPAGGVAGQNIAIAGEGRVFLNGFLNGVDTSAFNSGDPVYVAVGGGYTNVKPTGSANLIQALGYVEKSDSNGSGVIQGSGRANDVPNIAEGQLWVGNSDGVATPTNTSSLDVATAVSSSYADFASNAGLLDNKDAASFATTGSNVFSGGQTITGSLKQTAGSVDINSSGGFDVENSGGGIVSIKNTTGPIVMEAPGFGITGNINQFGNITSFMDAPSVSSTKTFYSINSASIGSIDYDNVTFGMSDNPGSGRFFEDVFGFRYFDSNLIRFGTAFEWNGQRLTLTNIPSGSAPGQNLSQIELVDNLNGTSNLNLKGDTFNAIGRNTLLLSNFSANAIQIDGTTFNLIAQGGSGTVNVLGSLDVNTNLTVQNNATIENVLKLTPIDPLPTGAVGELAVSGSNLYYHNGTSWGQLN